MIRRNIMSKFSNIDETLIIKAIHNNDTYRAILRELGLSSGEYNRKQLKIFMQNHNIEFVSNYKMNSPLAQITKLDLIALVNNSDTYAEILKKLGYGKMRNGAFITLKNKINKWGIDTSHMSHFKRANNEKATDETVFSKNSPHSHSTIRRYVISHNKIPYVCAVCGNKGEWNGKPLTLTLDHINGNRNDNRIENLRFICPNCDRQSDTYGTKNKHRYYKHGEVTEMD